jgi:tetraacyldisaccharide-1-P 4'-kinase
MAAMTAPDTAADLAVSPWQRLYAGAHRLRAAWYAGRARRLPRPVVSIGNLHWGGTGKTPLVAAVAGHLHQRGRAVCILSRGYGRRGHEVALVSGGAVPLAKGSRVVLVSAIARPERFAAAVRELDFAVMGEMRFPDHHPFPPASLQRIAALVETSGADAALTTAKDRVKLLGRLAVPLAELPIAAAPEPAFWEWLDHAVDALPGEAGGR